MKTAVSIPDELFEQADRLARKTMKSRSQVFSDALREYLSRYAPDEVTEAMDRVVVEAGQPNEDLTSFTARRILARSEW